MLAAVSGAGSVKPGRMAVKLLNRCCGGQNGQNSLKTAFWGEFARFDGLTDWESFANPGLAYKMT
jgi:hypothetical protein